MKAIIFPGQGSQFPGMGKELYQTNPIAKTLFEEANSILGFKITDILFEGTEEDLRQTKVTQPAVFLHSVILFRCQEALMADAVAGHSLGEFSALVANGCLRFEDGLKLVYQRALAMQKACEQNPGTMAAILGLDDAKVEEICADIKEEIVVAANYNNPGQLVISGSLKGIEIACERMKLAGAKRALPLSVGGAFHSPLMEPARAELQDAIANTHFAVPSCPVYQNVNGRPSIQPEEIQQNLIAQLTAPVRWTQSVLAMGNSGIQEFVECGPGKVLQGMVKKILPESTVSGI